MHRETIILCPYLTKLRRVQRETKMKYVFNIVGNVIRKDTSMATIGPVDPKY